MSEEVVKKKKPLYKKWWFWVVLILVLGGIGSQLQEEEQSPSKPVVSTAEQDNAQSNETQQETKEEEPDPEPVDEVIVITAGELFQAYEDNEVAADQKYKGKPLEISGTISDIGKDIIDRMYITLDTGDLILSVQVYFKKEHEDVIASLSKGQDVTIIGTGDGKSLNVMVKNAQIKE